MRSSRARKSSRCSAGSSARAVAVTRRSLKYPQGQGFMAAASVKRAGNVSDMAARRDGNAAILERLAHHFPARCGKLGNSSRKSTHWRERHFSRTRDHAAPIRPASELCGAARETDERDLVRNSRRALPPRCGFWWFSSASSEGEWRKDSGNPLGQHGLPEPGGPIIRMLCPPAHATSSARLRCAAADILKSHPDCCAWLAPPRDQCGQAARVPPFTNCTTR